MKEKPYGNIIDSFNALQFASASNQLLEVNNFWIRINQFDFITNCGLICLKKKMYYKSILKH